MKPKRYPYSGKIRNREKIIFKVGYINASNIKSNNSKITFSDGKIFVDGKTVRLIEKRLERWKNETTRYYLLHALRSMADRTCVGLACCV